MILVPLHQSHGSPNIMFHFVVPRAQVLKAESLVPFLLSKNFTANEKTLITAFFLCCRCTGGCCFGSLASDAVSSQHIWLCKSSALFDDHFLPIPSIMRPSCTSWAPWLCFFSESGWVSYCNTLPDNTHTYIYIYYIYIHIYIYVISYIYTHYVQIWDGDGERYAMRTGHLVVPHWDWPRLEDGEAIESSRARMEPWSHGNWRHMTKVMMTKQ